MPRVDTQPDTMDLMIFPQRRNLDTVYQLQWQLIVSNRPRRPRQPFRAVVIGDRQVRQTAAGRRSQGSFRLGERVERGVRVAVQVREDSRVA